MHVQSQNVQLGFQPGWGEVQLQLAATLHAALRRYWPHIRLHGELSTGSRTPASVQVPGPDYIWEKMLTVRLQQCAMPAAPMLACQLDCSCAGKLTGMQT